MPRARRIPVILTLALLTYVHPLFSSAQGEVSLEKASADRAAIVGPAFSELKDTLERSFPREEALESWAQTIVAQYPSVWYIMVTNFENKLVYTWYRDEAKPHTSTLENAFRGINKFTMVEGAKEQEVGGKRLLVTREKLVIEMDTYYFELGFGPIR